MVREKREIELQDRIDQLGAEKRDLNVLLRDPASFLCQEERRLLNSINGTNTSMKTHLKQYELIQNKIKPAHLKMDRQKHYLHNLIQTAILVERDENEAQKVRQRIEDLQAQIMDLVLANHENDTRIDELQTQRMDLEREIKELKTQIMHLKPANHTNKASLHFIEKNPNAANVYCVNLNN